MASFPENSHMPRAEGNEILAEMARQIAMRTPEPELDPDPKAQRIRELVMESEGRAALVRRGQELLSEAQAKLAQKTLTINELNAQIVELQKLPRFWSFIGRWLRETLARAN